MIRTPEGRNVEKLAIIGGGIAGMACAYFLADRCETRLFEANDYLGGHTHPVTVETDGGKTAFDTGFMVFNETNYPLLNRFFQRLGVPVENTSMSLSIRNETSGLEYNGSGLNGLFAQRSNCFRPRFYRFLLEINRFNRLANQELRGFEDSATLGEFLERHRFTDRLAEDYLLPMTAAIWSSSPEKMRDFPVAFLFAFLKNHGLLGLNTHFQWKTVKGSSAVYRDKILEACGETISLSSKVTGVSRTGEKIRIGLANGESYDADAAIMASHADQSLRMLKEPTGEERLLLGAFDYRSNRATVHRNPHWMPKLKRNWSSWNLRLSKARDGTNRYTATYYMNLLQNLRCGERFFVTLENPEPIPAEDAFFQFDYEHPVFNPATFEAQKNLPELNGKQGLYYCGSYFKNGFHEDAFASAVSVCEALTGERPL